MTIKSITASNCETSLATRSEDRRLYSQSTEFAVAESLNLQMMKVILYLLQDNNVHTKT